MQRVSMFGLVLALGAVGARAQVIEGELSAEETRTAGGPRLSVEYGVSPTQVGFALAVEGGAPFSQALLSLSTASGLEQRAWITLDAVGEAKVVERNAERGGTFTARCLIAPDDVAVRSQLVARSTVVDLSNVQQGPLALAAAGDLVICEIMKDPSFVTDSAGEWFEIRNRSMQTINLNGWRIADASGNGHTINSANGVIVAPRAYFILGINADPATNGGVVIGYKYPSSLSLSNASDEIRLSDPTGVLVDLVSYDDGIFWPDDAGKSISLNRAMIDSTLNDDGVNWCSALSLMSGSNTDLATPRLANNVCP